MSTSDVALSSPFFEIGIKNYIYGDAVLELARAVDEAAVEADVDVMMITPYADIRRVAEHTDRLIVLAPYMDVLRPGRGLADVLPESLYAAGARGVVINHVERPTSIQNIAITIARARELEMLSFVCADSITEARALAVFEPDIINPEPSELIGGSAGGDIQFMMESTAAIRAASPRTLVEQAAGITTAQQVYDLIRAGADGVGSASGILRSADPHQTACDMIHAVGAAHRDRTAPITSHR